MASRSLSLWGTGQVRRVLAIALRSSKAAVSAVAMHGYNPPPVIGKEVVAG